MNRALPESSAAGAGAARRVSRSAVRKLVKNAGGELLYGPFLDFLDPWGNRVEVIAYCDIQFTKTADVLRGMGLALDKTEKAKRELADKGMAPDPA